MSLANIWRSYEQECGVLFFRLTVYNMKRTTRSQHGRLINTTVKYARHILSNYS